MFGFDIPILVWALLGMALIEVAWTIIAGLRPMRMAATFRNPELAGDDSETTLPKASVIIFADKGPELLEETVAAVDGQDYPDFEIIIVAETSAESAAELSAFYTQKYPRARVTFMPSGSHNLSRRKLANTIGAKGAEGDVIVTILSNARIPSRLWLRGLLSGYAEPGVDICLGYSRIDFSELRGPWKWYRQFDRVLTDAQWIGYAATGHPYRGDGNNLSFRRELFFRTKGYSSTMHLHCGEDDLYVSEISDTSNTRVTVGEDTDISMDWGDAAGRVWTAEKERYQFTQRWLPSGPFTRNGFVAVNQWLIPLLLVDAALIPLPNLVPAITAAVILLAFWGMEIHAYRRVATRLRAVRLWWSVPLFWLVRPIANCCFRFSQRNVKKKNFTWQR